MGQVSGIHRKAFNSVLSGKKCQDGEIKKKKKKCKIQLEIRENSEWKHGELPRLVCLPQAFLQQAQVDLTEPGSPAPKPQGLTAEGQALK